jgi:peptidyl-prolyl cis-trans isomerase D
MLDIMRRKKRLKFILWLVIISLGLGMVLFFVPGGNIGDASIDSSAATVDGDAVSFQVLVQTYRRTVQSFTADAQNKIDPEILKSLGIGQRVLDGLISQRVMRIAAKQLGIEVSPEELRTAIETHPNLQNQGKFIGLQQYKALLAANSITLSEFEESLRDSLLTKKLRSVLTDSMDVTTGDLREEFVRSNQEAQVRYVLFKSADFAKQVKPTETDLRAYFDSHKTSYQEPERRRAQLLLIPLAAVMATITVTEAEIKQEWDKTPHEDMVEASHILFSVTDPSKESEVKTKAEEILKRAKAGEDFGELAKKYSEDTGSASQGGNLGAFPKGRMVPEFENVAFSMKPGEISELVRSQFGFHIIKVLRHETPSLDLQRGEISQSLQRKKAVEIAKQKAAEGDKLAEKQKDLGAIGKALQVPTEIKETGLLIKTNNALGQGLLPEQLDGIFQLKEIGAIGKAAEHPLGYAIPKLLEVNLPKPPDFALSRNSVESDFIDSKADELMLAEAKRVSAEAKQLSDLEKAAKQDRLSVVVSQSFKLDGVPNLDLGSAASFNSVAFKLPVGAVSEPISMGKQTAVLQVMSRTPFDEAAFEKQKEEIRARLVAWHDSYYQDYIRRIEGELRKAGKIRVNPKALDELARY